VDVEGVFFRILLPGLASYDGVGVVCSGVRRDMTDMLLQTKRNVIILLSHLKQMVLIL
jgi:hypothetical protein